MDNWLITPLEDLYRVLKTWWIVVIFAVLGAIAGLIIHRAMPPIYESDAEFVINIDFSKTGPIEEREQDLILWTAGGLIYSDAVFEQVHQAARALDIEIDVDSLKENAYLERRQVRWILIVRHAEPETAANLANLWADASNAYLTDAYQHAIAAETLRGYLTNLQECRDSEAVEEKTCFLPSGSEIESELIAVNARLAEEQQASLGISPVISYALKERAVVPQEPVLYARNSLVLVGLFIGFVLGIWATGLPFVRRGLDRI